MSGGCGYWWGGGLVLVGGGVVGGVVRRGVGGLRGAVLRVCGADHGAGGSGGEFSRGLLSAAYGGSVLTGGVAAVVVGRLADRVGVRWLMAGGSLVGAAGLLALASATAGWQVLALWWVVLGPVTALTFYEPAYVAIEQAFAAPVRPRAIGVLTVAAGLSGPIFTLATGALADGLGWRAATRVCWPARWRARRPSPRS